MRRKWKEELPDPVGTLFHRLWQDTSWLFATWEVFKELFAQGQEQAELLSWSGAKLFNLLDWLLKQEVFLALNRLTDPPGGRKRQNVSLRNLADAVRKAGDEDLAVQIAEEVNKIQVICEPLRQIRNRIIAHSDLATALEAETELMPGATLDVVEKAIRGVGQVMNLVEGHYRQSETVYEAGVITWDVRNVVLLLRQAKGRRRNNFGRHDTGSEHKTRPRCPIERSTSR